MASTREVLLDRARRVGDRHLPTTELDHGGAEFAVRRVEWRREQCHPMRRACGELRRRHVERCEIGLEFVTNATERQHVQHTLTVLQDVDELVAVAQHHAATVDDDVGRGDVGRDVLAEVLEHLADLFELDARVEQLLDRLQFEQVVVRVAATTAAARSRR